MKKAIIIALALLTLTAVFVAGQTSQQVISLLPGESALVTCADVPTETPTETAVSPTMTSTPPPTATNTAVPTATETTVYLPTVTSTASPTMTSIPTVDPTVTQAATSTPDNPPITGGIGVIGDSNSVAYQDWGRSGPDSRSWVEMSNGLRGADFGAYLSYYYNRASYWNKSRNTTGQAGSLQSYIQSGQIDIVLVWIGNVDIYEMCYEHHTPEQWNFDYDQMTTHPADALDQLISYGMPADKIYMVTLHYEGYEFPCSNAEQYRDFVDTVNAHWETMITSRGVNLIDGHAVFDALVDYQINDDGDIMIDGHLVTYDRCDNPNCLFVADGNFNTVLQGIAFNTWFAGPLGYQPFSDQEIVQAASLD